MIYRSQNAVLLITFIKFDTALEVLEKIREASPKRLYIASDGGRNPKEHNKILNFRQELLKKIDWDCEVLTFFSETNNGCKMGPYNAISWFFSYEEQGIILEDDCLPDNSFFQFCDILLDKYKNNNNVFMIGGWCAFDLSPQKQNLIKDDYFFSKYPHIWGWASWRRAWNTYKIEQFCLQQAYNLDYDSQQEKKYWTKIFSTYQRKNLDAWDYPMLYHIWSNHLLCIVPKTSMIQNIGLNRIDATHTTTESIFQKVQAHKQHFPIKHPLEISRDKELDKINFALTFPTYDIFTKIKSKLLSIFKRIFQ